jgi:hypothetical protein
MVMTTVKMMIMGHECLWGTVLEGSVGRGKERKLRGEEDGSTLHIYI